jgi:1-deoxy-D-xylulose-5-phosphate synthase
VITRKGFGYPLAEENDEDCLHQVSPAKPAAPPVPAAVTLASPAPAGPAPGRPWTQVFGDELVAIGATRPDVVAITAAMLHPTGLAKFAAAFPDRVFDVGIAEQHAVTSAAGLALGGMHPVAAIYATFLNRAFDQVLMDVALHSLPVTFVLDRAGVTGPDGASHHGMWDGSILQVVPGLRIAVPRDGARVAELLREAVAIDDGPTVVRFPGRLATADVPAVGKLGTMDVLRTPVDPMRRDVLLLGAGPMAGVSAEAADRLADHGIGVTVVDPRWVKPLDTALLAAARQHGLVVTVEDNGRVGGFGDAVARLLRDNDIDTPVRCFGLEQQFLEHGERAQVLDAQGLTPQHLARQITEIVAQRAPELADESQRA